MSAKRKQTNTPDTVQEVPEGYQRKRGKVYSERGFQLYGAFTDSYGARIRVKESSNAGEHCVWIFTHGGGTKPTDPDAETSPHLNVEQAKILRASLDKFIKDAS